MLLSVKTFLVAWRIFKLMCWPAFRIVRWGNETNHRGYVWLLIAGIALLPLELHLLNSTISSLGWHPIVVSLGPTFKANEIPKNHSSNFSQSMELLQHYFAPLAEWILIALGVLFLLFQFLILAPLLLLFAPRQNFLESTHRLANHIFPVRHREGLVRLGRMTPSGKLAVLGRERTMHMQIVGATGSGKTEALKRIIEADIASGFGVIWIDGKGDRQNAEWFAASADKYQRLEQVKMFLPVDKFGSYNPVLHGDSTELKDRIVSSIHWTEEYYKKRSEELLQAVATGLSSLGQPFTLAELAQALDPKSELFLRLLAESPEPRAKEQLARFARDKDWQQAVGGLASDLNQLMLSSYGKMFAVEQSSIDFRRAYAQRELVYVSLPISAAPQVMTQIGKLMLADLNSLNAAIATGQMNREPRIFSVIIDEFGNFVNDLFIAFLSQARSQNFAITLAHQSLGDLEKLDVAVRKQIQGNTNIKLILRQDAPEDAEIWARLIGTKQNNAYTRQTEKVLFFKMHTGLGSEHAVEEFIVHPNVIKRLGQGSAVLVSKEPFNLGVVRISRAARYSPSACAKAMSSVLNSPPLIKAIVTTQPTPKDASAATDNIAALSPNPLPMDDGRVQRGDEW